MKKYLLDLIKRKDLLIYLVISGLKAEYRNTYLGYFWWILDPLLMGMVFYFLRVIVLGMKGDNIGAFLFIGLIAWHWISQTVSKSAKSISRRASIITQVYLPKAIFPLGATLTESINFSFGLVLVPIFLLIYKLVPGMEVIWLPAIMLTQLVFLLAVSLIVAYLCMFIEDIGNVLSHLMRIWFWSSPVIYEAGRLPEKYRFIVDFNPASTFIISYRNVLMYGAEPLFNKLIIIGLISIVVVFYMIFYYSVNEHKIIRAL